MTPPEDFAFFQTFLRERSGFNLWPEKAYLLESRLARILRDKELASLGALAQRLRRGDPPLERLVVEAMMTHETFFFRDLRAFDLLRERIFPELAAARRGERRLRIWCAACSTGQEPYSIAMLLDETPVAAGWSVRILATDLSEPMIERAKEGLYTQFEVQRGLPVRLLIKHFTQTPEGWRIEPRLREKVEFRTFNLMRDPSAFGGFDLILCRNVMIYFDAGARAGLFARLRRRIAVDGALMLGGAETVIGVTSHFAIDRAAPGIYRPAAEAANPTLRRA